MTTGQKAVGVFKALFTELGYEFAESEDGSVITFSSEKPKFKLDVHRGEDKSFQKVAFEDNSEEDLKKLEAVITALSELFKGDSSENADANQPPTDGSASNEGDEKKEEKGEEPATESQEAKKEDSPAEEKEPEGESKDAEKPSE